MSTYTPTPKDMQWARERLAESLGRMPVIDGVDAAPHIVLGIVRACLDAAGEEMSPAIAERNVSRARAALAVLDEHRASL